MLDINSATRAKRGNTPQDNLMKNNYLRTFIVTAGAMLGLTGALLIAPSATAHSDKPHANQKKSISADEHPWGREGDPKKATRTINIKMADNMRFVPDIVEVKRGETIKFVVANNGKVMHEMVIGTSQELAKHAELMRKHPNMEHDEPYMAHVAASKRANMVWQFTKVGTFEFACLIPGHFEAGMRGIIRVLATN